MEGKKPLSPRKGLKSLFSRSEANLQEPEQERSGKSFKLFSWRRKKKETPEQHGTGAASADEETDSSRPGLQRASSEYTSSRGTEDVSLYGTVPRTKKSSLSYSETDLRKKKFSTFSFAWKKKKKKKKLGDEFVDMGREEQGQLEMCEEENDFEAPWKASSEDERLEQADSCQAMLKDSSVSSVKALFLPNTANTGSDLYSTGVSVPPMSSTDVFDSKVHTADISIPVMSSTDIIDSKVHTADISIPVMSSTDIIDSKVHTADISVPPMSSTDVFDSKVHTPDISIPVMSSTDNIDSKVHTADISIPVMSSTDIIDSKVHTPDISIPAMSSAGIIDSKVHTTDISNIDSTHQTVPIRYPLESNSDFALNTADIAPQSVPKDDPMLHTTDISIPVMSSTDIIDSKVHTTDISDIGSIHQTVPIRYPLESNSDFALNTADIAPQSVPRDDPMLHTTDISIPVMSSTYIIDSKVHTTDVSIPVMSSTDIVDSKVHTTDVSIPVISSTDIIDSKVHTTDISDIGTFRQTVPIRYPLESNSDFALNTADIPTQFVPRDDPMLHTTDISDFDSMHQTVPIRYPLILKYCDVALNPADISSTFTSRNDPMLHAPDISVPFMSNPTDIMFISDSEVQTTDVSDTDSKYLTYITDPFVSNTDSSLDIADIFLPVSTNTDPEHQTIDISRTVVSKRIVDISHTVMSHTTNIQIKDIITNSDADLHTTDTSDPIMSNTSSVLNNSSISNPMFNPADISFPTTSDTDSTYSSAHITNPFVSKNESSLNISELSCPVLPSSDSVFLVEDISHPHICIPSNLHPSDIAISAISNADSEHYITNAFHPVTSTADPTLNVTDIFSEYATKIDTNPQSKTICHSVISNSDSELHAKDVTSALKMIDVDVATDTSEPLEFRSDSTLPSVDKSYPVLSSCDSVIDIQSDGHSHMEIFYPALSDIDSTFHNADINAADISDPDEVSHTDIFYPALSHIDMTSPDCDLCATDLFNTAMSDTDSKPNPNHTTDPEMTNTHSNLHITPPVVASTESELSSSGVSYPVICNIDSEFSTTISSLNSKFPFTDPALPNTHSELFTIDPVMSNIDSKLHSTNSTMSSPDSKLPITDSIMSSTDSNFHVTGPVISTADCKFDATDSVLSSLDSNLYITNTVMPNTNPKIHATDSVMFSTVTKLHTTDTVMSIPDYKIHTTDSALSTTESELRPIDTMMPNIDSKVPTTDSLISRTDSKHTTDTMMPNTDSKVPTTDSVISSTDSKHHITDTMMPNIDSKVPTTDALISRTDSKHHITDTMMPNSDSKLLDTDSVISRTDSKLHTTDPMMPNTNSKLPTTDSVMSSTDSKHHITDTMMPNTDSKLPTTDSVMSSTDSKHHITDTMMPNSDSKLLTTDSVMSSTDSKHHIIDTIMPNSDSKLPTTGSVMSSTDSKHHITDTIMPNSDSKLPTTGSVMSSTDSKHHITDTMMPNTDSKLPTTDSVMSSTDSKHHITDISLSTTFDAKVHTTDKIQQDTSSTSSTDSNAEPSPSNTFSTFGSTSTKSNISGPVLVSDVTPKNQNNETYFPIGGFSTVPVRTETHAPFITSSFTNKDTSMNSFGRSYYRSFPAHQPYPAQYLSYPIPILNPSNTYASDRVIHSRPLLDTPLGHARQVTHWLKTEAGQGAETTARLDSPVLQPEKPEECSSGWAESGVSPSVGLTAQARLSEHSRCGALSDNTQRASLTHNSETVTGVTYSLQAGGSLPEGTEMEPAGQESSTGTCTQPPAERHPPMSSGITVLSTTLRGKQQGPEVTKQRFRKVSRVGESEVPKETNGIDPHRDADVTSAPGSHRLHVRLVEESYDSVDGTSQLSYSSSVELLSYRSPAHSPSPIPTAPPKVSASAETPTHSSSCSNGSEVHPVRRVGAEPAAPARERETDLNSGSDSPPPAAEPFSGVFTATRVELQPEPDSLHEMNVLVDTLRGLERPTLSRAPRTSHASVSCLPPIEEDVPPLEAEAAHRRTSLPAELGITWSSTKEKLTLTPLDMMKRHKVQDPPEPRVRSLSLPLWSPMECTNGASQHNGGLVPSPSRLGSSLLFSSYCTDNSSYLPESSPTAQERMGVLATSPTESRLERFSFLKSPPASLSGGAEPRRLSAPPDLPDLPELKHVGLGFTSPFRPMVEPEPEEERMVVPKYRAFPDTYLTKEKEHGKLNPRPGKLLIYTQPSMVGDSVEVRGDVIDATPWELPETIWIRVVRGGWVLYEHPDFKGRKVALDEGDVEIRCPFGPHDDMEENGEDEKLAVQKKFVIGSMRRAVRDYSVPEICLFPEENGEGKKVIFRDTSEDARIFGLPIKANSIIINAGLWLVFPQPFFQGSPQVLEVGGYTNPASWGVTEPYVCSVHPLKIGEPRVELLDEPKLVIYERPYFTGKSREIYTNTRDFMTRVDNRQSVFMFSVGSIKVLGGCWVGYEKEGFRGHQYLLEEGEYHDWRVWGGCDCELRSVRVIRADLSEPVLVMYELPEVETEGQGVEDRRFEVTEATPDVEPFGFRTLTRSVHVLSGAWVAYSHVDFSGHQYVLEKGFYPCCTDWGSEDNRICSLQPILRAPSESQSYKPEVLLYPEPAFQGIGHVFQEDHKTLPEGFVTASCRVLKGSWVLFEGASFCGNSYVLSEGEYPNHTSMGLLQSCSLRSLKAITVTFTLPSISLFGKECFEGREVTLDTPTLNLLEEGYNNHTMSVRVSRGCWVLFEHSNYRGRQILLEPNEISNWPKFSEMPTIGSLYPIQQRRHFFRVKNKAYGHFLSVQGGVEEMKSGRVVVSEQVDGFSEVWFYQDGLIKNKLAPSMSLQVMGSVEAGSKVVLWSETRMPVQMWSASISGPIPSLTFPGLVMDVKGGKSYDRDHVVVFGESEERASQQWELELL